LVTNSLVFSRAQSRSRSPFSGSLTSPKSPEGGEKVAEATSDPSQLVREAYLRTLGRPPVPRELEIAANYFTDVSDTGKGLRDLLWALLNTKEFVTNH